MDPTEAPAKPAARRIVAAFAVHVFTACGAACALLALIAAVNGGWTAMFAWLGVALVIDGVDGTFARRLRVGEVLPRWSGDTNFVTVVGDIRVVPQALADTYRRLKDGFGR